MQKYQEVISMSLPPSHQAMRQLVLRDLSEPCTFRGVLLSLPDWEEPLRWTPEYLAKSAPDLTTSFKVGRRSWLDGEEGSHHETECSYVEATLSEFVSWVRQDIHSTSPATKSMVSSLSSSISTDYPSSKRAKLSQDRSHHIPVDPLVEGVSPSTTRLSSFATSDHWAYCDYKYMYQLFQDHAHLLTSLDWSALGFKGRGGDQSTIWIGSELAHTPCHYDTYGCNLVAQLHGRKRWYLLAPSESGRMYASRIPYEESSVFSAVSIEHPDYATHPKFKQATVFEVVLEPGDVLFVPKHWWHFVVCLNAAVSVNTWIELDSDPEDRLREALVRIMVFSLKSCDQDVARWLNPKEDYSLLQDNINFLEKALGEIIPLNKSKGTKKVKLEETLLRVLTQTSVLDIVSQELLKLLRDEAS